MGSLPHSRSRRGVSLVEVIVVASILALLAATLVTASGDMSGVTAGGSVESRLQEEAQEALRRITGDLRRAGYVTTTGGVDYPFTFEAGVFDPPHGHPPATQAAEPGDPDFGVMREIVLVLPSDVDRDGRPDVDNDLNGVPELDGNGDGVYSEDPTDIVGWDPAQNTIDGKGLAWSHEEVSYVAVTAPDGQNYVERRVAGDPASARRFARGVELLQFDLADGAEVPLGAVRMRAFFRMHDPRGTLYTHRIEVVVSLRNGGV